MIKKSLLLIHLYSLEWRRPLAPKIPYNFYKVDEQQQAMSHLPVALSLRQLQEVRLHAGRLLASQKKLKIVETQEEFGRFNYMSKIQRGQQSHKTAKRLTAEGITHLTKKS